MPDPVVAEPGPCSVALKVGRTYFWCACGRSATQPFCDGAHKAVGMAPLMFAAQKSEQVWLCGCKATQGQPFCDGSHSKL